MRLRMFQRYARFLGLFSLVAALVSFTACRQVDPKTPKIDQEESSSQAVSATESDSSSDDGSWEDLDEGKDEDLSSLDSPDGSKDGESDGPAAVRTTHEVKPGETLWDIANQYYGRGIYWRAIRDHNNLPESGNVNAGQTLEIPELTEQRKEELRQLAADKSGGTSSSSGGASGGDTYVTKQGDTFWKIAKRVYGSGTQWKRIWRANKSKVPNPDKLKAGTKIRIPGANASSAEKGTSDEQKGAN